MPLGSKSINLNEHLELNEFTDKDQSSLPLYDLVGCDWSNFLFTNSKGESNEAGLRFSGTIENYK